jgi:hypothetical protein
MNSKMAREIRGAKINPKSCYKNYGAQNTRGRKLREQIRYFGFYSALLHIPAVYISRHQVGIISVLE